MTWFVRHMNRDCWVCQRKTKQVVSQEKMDMRGVSMRYRTCSECGHRLHSWVAVPMPLAETLPAASA
jgi:transcriptional regulator NrdR family protein